MRNAAATLIVDQELMKAVLVFTLGSIGTVFSFERCSGALVGTHSFVPDVETQTVITRLDNLVNEWRQAGQANLLFCVN